jgi:hypothetical protein
MKHDFGIISESSEADFAKKHGLKLNSVQLGKVSQAKATIYQIMRDKGLHNHDRNTYPLIAGGAISRIFRQDEDGGDVDVYGYFGKTISMELRLRGAEYKYAGENTIQVCFGGIDYNFILNTHSDPDVVLNLFDFNIVRLATSIASSAVYYHPRAIDDLKTKTVSLSGCPMQVEAASLYPQTLQLRKEKYAAMGYHFGVQDFLDSIPLGDESARTLQSELTDNEKYEIIYKCLELAHKHQNLLMQKKRKSAMEEVAREVISRDTRVVVAGDFVGGVAIGVNPNPYRILEAPRLPSVDEAIRQQYLNAVMRYQPIRPLSRFETDAVNVVQQVVTDNVNRNWSDNPVQEARQLYEDAVSGYRNNIPSESRRG